MTIDIPQGGSGSSGVTPNDYKLLTTIVVDREVASVHFDDGGKFDYTHVIIKGQAFTTGNVKSLTFFNSSQIGYGHNLFTLENCLANAIDRGLLLFEINTKAGEIYFDVSCNMYNSSFGDGATSSKRGIGGNLSYNKPITTIKSINIGVWSKGQTGTLGVGSKFEIWAK